jgi:hypothetical protein
MLFESDDFESASARSISPTQRCSYPNSASIAALVVPFPLPGPPSTKMTAITKNKLKYITDSLEN